MMSTIYRCATVTIIALTGGHSNAGLHGVSVPRVMQVEEAIDGQHFFTVPQIIEKEEGASKWHSRAWTYQEMHFSTRMLTFAES